MSKIFTSTSFFGASRLARPATVAALEALEARLFDDSSAATEAQVKTLEARIKVLEARKSREVASALASRRVKSSTTASRQVRSGSVVSAQTAAAQHTSTGGNDDDPADADEAAIDALLAAATSTPAQPDPDPFDLVIFDPCKNDPRVIAYGDTPRARYIRKAIVATSLKIGHPATDYYVSHLLASLTRVIKSRVRLMSLRIPKEAAADMVQSVAVSILQKLAAKHEFDKIPNPNLMQLVVKYIKIPANLREVSAWTTRSDTSGLDMLDVADGLARPPDISFVPDYFDMDKHPDDVPPITSEAFRQHEKKCREAGYNAQRAAPTTRAEDENISHDPLENMAQPDPMQDPFMLTWARELIASKRMPDVVDDPDGVVQRAVKEALFFASGPEEAGDLDLDGALVLYAGLPEEDARARALNTMRALCEVMDDTRQHIVGNLRARAANRKGQFSPEVQQGAAALLKGAGYPV